MRKTLVYKLAGVVILLLCLTVQAGVVTRPTKTCGTTSYAAEVAAGCITIKSSEVDADLNAILTGGVNNIETANVNVAGLGTAAITDLAITTAKINDLGVTTGKINNLAVTNAKLAVGSTIDNAQVANVTTSLALDTTTETTVVTLPSITTAGGRVVIGGSWSLLYTCSGAGVGDIAIITARIKRDGSTIHTVIQGVGTVVSTGTVSFDLPIAAMPQFTEVPTLAAHIYTMTVQIGSAPPAGCSLVSSATFAGQVSVIEWR